MDFKEKLEKLLSQLEPEQIRRAVCDIKGNILANGIAFDSDGDLSDFVHIDFKGKSVVDVGCNLGHYSLLSSQKGAQSVLGIDLDLQVLKGAELMRDMYNINNVEYLEMDFTNPSFTERFDISMLIDFFGKKNITKGVTPYLSSLETMTKQTMIISAREHYQLNKHFEGVEDKIKNNYPSKFVQNNRFYLKGFIIDYFKDKWNHTVLTNEDSDSTSKQTIYFQKK